LSEHKPGFVAHASNPHQGTEAVAGKIIFDRWRLRFESSAVTLEIPLTRLEIEVGEPGEGGVCFSDPELAGWTICTFEADILKAGPLLQQSHTRHQIKEFQSHGDLNRRLKITLGFMVGFAVVAFMVSVLMGMMVRSLVASIPPKWEQELGDGRMAELKQEHTFVQEPKLLAKLDRAVAPLIAGLPASQTQYTFYLLEEPLPNAFALPGGHVIVTTRLLELADRPEELAGVVAHEIAHVTQKHGFRQAISSYGPYLLFKLFAGTRGGLLGALGGSSQLLVSRSFSQEYELEADAVGWQSLVNAHIDPRGMVDMLMKFQAMQRGMGAEPMVQAFSSHPATEKRIRRLEAKWKKLKNKSGFIVFDETP
jgi:Zn-dependent protease with chaperone function